MGLYSSALWREERERARTRASKRGRRKQGGRGRRQGGREGRGGREEAQLSLSSAFAPIITDLEGTWLPQASHLHVNRKYRLCNQASKAQSCCSDHT